MKAMKAKRSDTLRNIKATGRLIMPETSQFGTQLPKIQPFEIAETYDSHHD